MPVTELAILQRAAEDRDPALRSVVEDAAGAVRDRVAADHRLGREAAVVGRVVRAADPGDPEVGALIGRLREVSAVRTRLAAEVGLLVADATAAGGRADRDDATVQAVRVGALGGLDDALAAARELTADGGPPTGQSPTGQPVTGSQETWPASSA